MIGRAGAAGRQLLRHRRAAPCGAILAYHDIVAGGTRARDRLTVPAPALRAQLRTVRRLGMRVVPLGELTRRVLAGLSTAGLAAVTFDDALVGVARHGIPVLLEEAVPATLLPVTGSLGQSPRWWPSAARTMSRGELAVAVSAGFALAAHTRSHRSLTGLCDAELTGELAGCRADLADLAGAPVDLLAYPFGHHDGRVRRAAASAGFRAGFTFLNGRLTGHQDPFRLPRLTMHGHLGISRLTYQLCRPAHSWPDHQLDHVGPVTA